MDQAVEKRSSGENDGFAAIKHPCLVFHTCNPPPMNDKARNESLPEMKVLLFLQNCFHGQAIELLIALDTGRLDGGSFGSVQCSEVNGRFISNLSHFSTQRVHFLDKLSFGKATDGGIAGHQCHGVEIYIEHQRFATHPSCSKRCLAARMPSTYDDDVIITINHFLLPPEILAV
jgi:hypothetical protein